jgi:DnaK suppressor protein
MSLEHPDHHKLREQLWARRADLLARYRGELERADEDTATRSRELVDTASDQWDARVLESMSDVDAAAVERVTAAIERIDAGIYGTCLVCGDLIEPARLRALPEAAECIDCVRFAEDTPPRSVTSVDVR